MAHRYNNSQRKSKILRKPLDILYNQYGSFKHETVASVQRTEIDVYWKLPNKLISVEEKCHKKDWWFKDEMLFELEHWYLNGSFKGKGWALGIMKSDIIIDFCFETSELYVYYTAPLMPYIQACYNNNNYPTGSSFRTCENEPDNPFGSHFITKNLKMPRKYIEQFLYTHGRIINGQYKDKI